MLFNEKGEFILTDQQVNRASFGKSWLEKHNMYMERGPGIHLPLDWRNCDCHKVSLPVYDHWDPAIRKKI